MSTSTTCLSVVESGYIWSKPVWRDWCGPDTDPGTKPEQARSELTSGPVMCIIPDMAEAMES